MVPSHRLPQSGMGCFRKFWETCSERSYDDLSYEYFSDQIPWEARGVESSWKGVREAPSPSPVAWLPQVPFSGTLHIRQDQAELWSQAGLGSWFYPYAAERRPCKVMLAL